MQGLWKDARHGLRTLARSPGFTLVALITLALGIGANTAIFSAVYRVLLHPLPYPQPDQIVAISRTGEMMGGMPERRGGPSVVARPEQFVPANRGAEGSPRVLMLKPGQTPGAGAATGGSPAARIRRGGPIPEQSAGGGERGPVIHFGAPHQQPTIKPGRVAPSPGMRIEQQPASSAGAEDTRRELGPKQGQPRSGSGIGAEVSRPGPVLQRGGAGETRAEGGLRRGPVRERTMQIGGGPGGRGRGGRPGFEVFSYPDFEYLQKQSDAFEEVAAYHESQVTLTQRGQPASLHAVVASASLLRLLRAKPLVGRSFTAQDDREGATPVAMIGEGLWRERFSANPAVIGQTINLNNQAYTVIGVLPSHLIFPPFEAQAQVWIPLVDDPAAEIQNRRFQRGVSYLTVLARLKPQVTLERANAELSTLADQLGANYPEETGRGMEATPLAQQLVQNYQLALFVLLAAVALVLLIACANVANLLLARATVRERELALRLALGAGQAGIIRQMLIESLELALAGGAAGVIVAYWAVASFTQHLPPLLQEFQGVTVNGGVLGFSALISIGAGIIMGLLPAWRLSDLRIQETLQGSGNATGTSSAKGRLRAALVMLEVALAVVLLAGAGLLLRSFGKLVSVPLGFQPQGVLLAQTNLSAAGMRNPGQWKSFTQTVLDRLKGQPGVQQAAASTTPPMSGMRMMMSFSIVGQPLAPDEMPVADFHSVTPGYFELMRIPLLHGRTFTNLDSDTSAHVCVVNQALAQRYFSNVDPLTQQIRAGMPPAPCQIVGIVGNVVTGSLATVPGPAIYFPFQQFPFFAPTFLVRATGNPVALSGLLEEQLHSQNPALPVAPVALDSLLSRSLAQDRLRTTLVTLFAVLAILLAAVGISGVLGYSVSRRTREIGVRMALGAQPKDVLRQVVGEGLRLVGFGAAVGMAAALGLTRFMRTLLYGVSPADAMTYVAVALVLVVVALMACALPAARAARVDPTVALRYE